MLSKTEASDPADEDTGNFTGNARKIAAAERASIAVVKSDHRTVIPVLFASSLSFLNDAIPAVNVIIVIGMKRKIPRLTRNPVTDE